MTWGQLAAAVHHTTPTSTTGQTSERTARMLAGAILARPEVQAAVPPVLLTYWRRRYAELPREGGAK